MYKADKARFRNAWNVELFMLRHAPGWVLRKEFFSLRCRNRERSI